MRHPNARLLLHCDPYAIETAQATWLRTRPFPEEWLTLIQRHVVFFRRLSASDRAELLGHIQVFLAEKRFEGCGGFAITDEVRVTIAAQACLLLLHRRTDYFPGLLTILVYPLTYMVEEKRQIGEHVWEEGTVSRLGETGRRMGSLVLSWGAVKHGAADPSDGKNVVLHEFAHQLDYENDAADGVPGLATREQQLAWSRRDESRVCVAARCRRERNTDACSIRTEPPILLSSSRYQSRHSLSSRTRCAPVIQNCTLSCKSIFSRTRWNFLLSNIVRPSSDSALRVPHQNIAHRIPAKTLRRLLRLRNDPKIRLWRFPALWITPLRLLVGDRARDDHVLSWLPVDWRSHLVLRGQLQ